MKVEFYRHNIGDEEIKRVVEVLQSTFLTTGEVVSEFELKFSQYLQCKNVIGVTSCTAALHLALLAYGIGPEDEVITTPLSFIATSNAIIYAGATPVFVDVEPETGNINAGLIEQAITSKTKAIIPVHLYGQMCDMKKIRDIANGYDLIIIEDCAHCVEGKRDGVKPGQLSDAACFSFYATKNITSGEGGAISTNNLEIAEKLKKLRLHGMSKSAANRYNAKYQHWDMEMLGWKYNMSNIQAALLIHQLNRIDELLTMREIIARNYEEAFKDASGIEHPVIVPESKSARHLFTIWVDPEKRDKILWKLQEKDIGVAVNYKPIHLTEFYKKQFKFKEGDFPVAEQIGSRTISIPLYPKLKRDEQYYIINTVRSVISDTA